jgi:hypothetical protein
MVGFAQKVREPMKGLKTLDGYDSCIDTDDFK